MIKDQFSKVQKLFFDKKYDDVENFIKNLGELDSLPEVFLNFYATSKLLNPKSDKNDYLVSAFYFQKIYERNHKKKDILSNLIIASIKANNFKYAEQYLILEYDQDPENPRILEGLSKMHHFRGDIKKSSFFLKKYAKRMPEINHIWPSYLATLNYLDSFDQKKYLEECLIFDQSKLIKSKIELTNKKNKKIKLAFLSADFGIHSVSQFLKPLIQNFNKKNFELFALCNKNLKNYDSTTFELKRYFDFWVDVTAMTDVEMLNYSRSLNLDILIDLSGFSLGNRIDVVRSRIATNQVLWCGYCNTLGIKNMDYIISDPNLILNEEKNLYLEKIKFMPKIWNCLSKEKAFPNIENKNKNKKFIFGSFNNFRKISDETVKIWSSILNNTESVITLKCSSQETEELERNLLNKFSKYTEKLNNIKILKRIENKIDHLRAYNFINLSLDTFPYPGVTTSFESIAMGVPVLTMQGFNFNSRCGESINRNLGLEKFIANSKTDYIDKAIYYYKNPEELTNISGENLRKLAFNSPLFDEVEFSKNFEKILLDIYSNNL